jgi:hypothetical protein
VSDPISRLQLARQEIDRVFGPGHAAANPQLVAAVMAAASRDYAAQLVARTIEHVRDHANTVAEVQRNLFHLGIAHIEADSAASRICCSCVRA